MKKKKSNKFYLFFKTNYIFKIFSLILFLILIDQITKVFFTNKFYFQDFFINISFSKNTGSAFSLFSSLQFYNLFLIILSFILLFFLIFKFNFFLKDKILKICFIFLISGILGNLLDRILFNYVRDFIFLKGFSIFNFADIYLNLAFFSYLIFEYNLYKNSKINK